MCGPRVPQKRHWQDHGSFLYGQIGQTEYIINKVKEETGMYDAKVVVTGGLGRIISNETENVDVYDPDLTLKGINLVYRKQNRKGVK